MPNKSKELRVSRRVALIALLRNTNLANLDTIGRGPWTYYDHAKKRCIMLHNNVNDHKVPIYYGTRTGRTYEESEMLAVALCKVLNVFKVKKL